MRRQDGRLREWWGWMEMQGWVAGEGPCSSLLLYYSLLTLKRDQTTALRCGPRTLVPKYIRCSQLPEGSTVMQVMENPRFSLKSTFDIWLNSSSTSWAINTILAFLCTLGLFFLFFPYFQNKPTLPPLRKHRNTRKVRNLWPWSTNTWFSLFFYYFQFSESTGETLEMGKNRTSILKEE